MRVHSYDVWQQLFITWKLRKGAFRYKIQWNWFWRKLLALVTIEQANLLQFNCPKMFIFHAFNATLSGNPVLQPSLEIPCLLKARLCNSEEDLKNHVSIVNFGTPGRNAKGEGIAVVRLLQTYGFLFLAMCLWQYQLGWPSLWGMNYDLIIFRFWKEL